MKDRKRWEYAYYIGDELKAQGTAIEICKELGLDIKTFWFYRTKTYQERYNKNEDKRRTIVRTDVDLQEN